MNYVLDPLERAGRTFLQQFVVILLATGDAGLLVTQNWAFAADSAGFAAVVSVLTSVLTFKVQTLPAAADLALRVAKTFVQSLLGTLAASHITSVAHADWKGALAIAVPVALTALLTGLLALAQPGTNGASFLPAGATLAIDDGSAPEIDVTAKKVSRDVEESLNSLKVSDPPDGPKHAA